MSKIKWTLVAGISTGSFALAVFLYLQNLDRADQWASVLALFVSLATLTIGLMTRPGDTKTLEPGPMLTPPSVVTNHGVINQVNIGDYGELSQTNNTYYPETHK